MKLSRSSKIALEVCILLLVLVAVAIGIARSFFPHLDRYKPYFEQWASTALHQPVTIQKIQTTWIGLHPMLSLEGVDVLDTATQQPRLHIQRLQVGANVVSSILQRRFVPSSVTIVGAQVQARRISNSEFTINGIAIPLPASTASELDIGHIFALLVSQGDFRLENIDLDWQDQAGQALQFTHLTGAITKGFFKDRVMGAGVLAGKTPTRFRFVAHIQAGSDPKNMSAEGYLSLKNLNLSPWLVDKLPYGLQLVQGNLDRLQLWAHWQNNQWQSLQSLVQLKQLVLQTEPEKSLQVDEFSGNLAWQRHRTGINFAADDIRLRINQQLWPLTQLSWQQSQIKDASTVQILRADALDLTQLRNLLPALPTAVIEAQQNTAKPVAENSIKPTALLATIDVLQPQGRLNNLLVRRDILVGGEAFVSASTDFADLKTQALRQIPAIDGLQGTLKLTPTAGSLVLKGDHLWLDATAWFAHAFELHHYQGKLDWAEQADGFKLQGGDVALADAHMGVRGNFNLWLPKREGESPYLELLTALSEHDSSYLRDYVPVGILTSHTALATWLTEAFTAGAGIEGQLLLQGPLTHFPFDDYSGRFEARVHVNDMLFNYKTGWPSIAHLTADTLFEGRSLHILAEPGAKILGAAAGDIKAQIPNLADAVLTVQGQVHSDMQQGLDFIAKSPLQKTIGEGLENLKLHGPMQLALGLRIPLHAGDEASTVKGDVTVLPNAILEVPAWNIHLTDFGGAFEFTENGLSANQLKAKWLDQPVAIHIETANDPAVPDSHTIFAHIKGDTSIEDIQKAYGFSVDGKITGATTYSALLKLNRKNGHTQTVFSIDSDLQGVTIDLPNPFKKSSSEKTPLHIETKAIEKAALNLWIQFAKKWSAALTFAQDAQKTWALKQGNIRLGTEPAEFQALPSGLLIDGSLSQFIWSEVSHYLSPLFSGKKANSQHNSLNLQLIDLEVKQLSAFGVDIASANVQAKPETDAWDIQIDSPIVVGQLTIPTDLSQAIIGDFSRFGLAPGASATVSGINPGDIPPLDLKFKDFYYDNKLLTNVSLVTTAAKNMMQIDRLKVDIGDTRLWARGRWQQVEKRHQQTTLSGNLRSDDIGAALKAMQITSSVVNGRGNAAFAVSWPAAAYDFSFKQINGSFSLAFNKGRIVDIGDNKTAEMGIGRILNLLSLQSIPRRLSLDFSDLLQKGFAFDEMKGEFSMKDGDATTNNAYMDGPIAKIAIEGRIGMANRDYDLFMTITPYLTSSLPVAATIVGGPIAGAATWLGSKVLSGVVDSISKHVYKITGSWDKPLIETATANRQTF